MDDKGQRKGSVYENNIVHCLQVRFMTGKVQHFGKYIYFLSCWEFNDKTDTTLIVSVLTLELEPGGDSLSLAENQASRFTTAIGLYAKLS